jgi:uncharacterized protein (DUF433 family)
MCSPVRSGFLLLRLHRRGYTPLDARASRRYDGKQYGERRDELERIELGNHIVADPRICHGRLTFKGTRLFVSDVLEMVAEGTDWETIIRECHGSISREAIAEAVRLASKA